MYLQPKFSAEEKMTKQNHLLDKQCFTVKHPRFSLLDDVFFPRYETDKQISHIPFTSVLIQ